MMEMRMSEKYSPFTKGFPGKSPVNARRRVPYAFISCPFDGNLDKYLEQVRPYCNYAIEHGYVPITPYIMFGTTIPVEDKQVSDRFVLLSANLMLRCDEFWFPGFADSEIRDNMLYELAVAIRQEKPIKFIDEEDADE